MKYQSLYFVRFVDVSVYFQCILGLQSLNCNCLGEIEKVKDWCSVILNGQHSILDKIKSSKSSNFDFFEKNALASGHRKMLHSSCDGQARVFSISMSTTFFLSGHLLAVDMLQNGTHQNVGWL